MQPETHLASLKRRFTRLFFRMANNEGRAYAEGFLIGWLAYLARFDMTIIQKLNALEQKYGIDDDGRS